MISRTAGNDINLIEGIEIVCVPFELVHDNGLAVFGNALAHRIADSFWLLVDFLEHEVLIAALFCSFCIPVDLKDLFRHRLTAAVRNFDGILRNNGEFTIVEDVRTARAGNDGRDIGSDKVLAFTDADDQWIVLLRADELVRLSLAHEDQRVRAFDAVQYLTDGRNEIAIVDFFEKMGNDFCIRFRLENMALLDEFFLQAQIVLDDAVMDNDKIARAVRMRMCVAVGRTAVRCPARMTNADGALRHIVLDLVA